MAGSLVGNQGEAENGVKQYPEKWRHQNLQYFQSTG
jgi:hypothetical protein